MARPKQPNRYDVEKYQDEVLSGKRPAGKSEIAAIQRHVDDLKNAGHRGYYFSWDHAEIACDWFPLLTHPRGAHAGTRFRLVPAQKSFVSILAGWRKSQNNLRRFRTAFLSMARGNGKSPIAAGIALMLFAGDVPFAPGAEVACAATTRSQAKKYVWSQARDFIRAVPSLDKRMKILKESIEFPVGNSVGTFEPLGSDSNNLDGGNYHAAIIDELHAMREQHREMMEKIRTSMGKRLQDLLIYITTAGSDRSRIWLEEYDYAMKVLLGIVTDDQYMAYIFEGDKGDDPHSEHTWRKANPLFDFLDRDKFDQMSRKAMASPTALNELLRYKINVLVSSREKAFPPELWAKGNGRLPVLDGKTCFGGLDLGWRDDLAAFVLCFPIKLGNSLIYCFKVFAWIPRDGCRDLSREPFRSLIASGQLQVTDGNTTDPSAIINTILDCRKRYKLQSVAADGNNARSILTDIQNNYDIPVYEFFQTCRRYNEPTIALLDALDDGRVRHGGNDLFAWAADNTILKSDGPGYVMPDKAKSTEKIDPIVAGIMALSEAMFGQTDGGNQELSIRGV